MLVELVCERPLGDVAQADAFVPRFGGSVASVAVTAARLGARVALAGGAGDDGWGHWLRDRLVRERVDLSLFELAPGVPTPLALVAVGPAGEPTRQIYGGDTATVRTLADRVEAAIEAAAGLFFGSGTLVGAEEREVTMRAREIALALGRPVVFDPNLRLDCWRSRSEAAAVSNACVPGALLVRTTAQDAALMTGEEDPDRAALALLKAGPQMVVITVGPCAGAILRGELRLDVPGPPAAVRSTIGAGDVLTGVLLARLAMSGFYPAAVAASLPEALAQAALACERWGALD